MGEAKRRLDRFKQQYPMCCFCGGTQPTETIDHVPSRNCFAGRQAPESFEFPACSICQVSTRIDELVFGFVVRLADLDDANFRSTEFNKALRGVINNAPHVLPSLNLSSHDKRKSLKEMEVIKPHGMIWDDVPLVWIPEEVHYHIARFIQKLALALFYREQGRVAGRHYGIWTIWCQASDKARMNSLDKFISMTPLITVGERSNYKLGNQFGYRCNKSDNPDIFAAISQFGLGVVVGMVVVSDESAEKLEFNDWVRVEGLFR